MDASSRLGTATVDEVPHDTPEPPPSGVSSAVERRIWTPPTVIDAPDVVRNPAGTPISFLLQDGS